MALQKGSFCVSKGVLLECKRTTFFRVPKFRWFSAIIILQRYKKMFDFDLLMNILQERNKNVNKTLCQSTKIR